VAPGPNRFEDGLSAFTTGARAAAAWGLEALAALVPERCVACSRALPPREGRAVDRPCGLCAPCAAGVVPLGRPFCLDGDAGEARWRCRHPSHLRLLAAAQYGGAIGELVRAAKFRDAPLLLSAWEEVWDAARAASGVPLEACDVLVPVPAHPARVRERGFDVTASWAERLSRFEGIPFARALARRRSTPPQVGLDRARRAANVAGAFAPAALASALRGRRVALVDDVVTTGATVRAAAAVVRECGARAVSVWALAYEPLE
jgi:ComF family protein